MSSTISNERLIALADPAIRSFITALKKRVTTELRDRALKPDEAFVTLEGSVYQISYRLSYGEVRLEVEIRDGRVYTCGELRYDGGCTLPLGRDASNPQPLSPRGSTEKAMEDEIYYVLKHLNGYARPRRDSRKRDGYTPTGKREVLLAA